MCQKSEEALKKTEAAGQSSVFQKVLSKKDGNRYMARTTVTNPSLRHAYHPALLSSSSFVMMLACLLGTVSISLQSLLPPHGGNSTFFVSSLQGPRSPFWSKPHETPKISLDEVGGIISAPERGMMLSRDVTARELYASYERIKDAHLDTLSKKWKVLQKKSDGVEISIQDHPTDSKCPYVKMEVSMPGIAVEEVWSYLHLDQWEKTMPKMDPFYEGLDIYKTYMYNHNFGPVEMILGRKRTRRIMAFGKRDFTFVSVSDAIPKNRDRDTWMSGTVSVQGPTLPRQQGYTRAFQDSIALYQNVVESDGVPGTLLTILCRIDLNDSRVDGEGGSIPMWIYTKTIGTTGATSMRNMRKEINLIAEKKEQQQRIAQLKSKRLAPPIPIIPWWKSPYEQHRQQQQEQEERERRIDEEKKQHFLKLAPVWTIGS
jgi:hypothetical protein